MDLNSNANMQCPSCKTEFYMQEDFYHAFWTDTRFHKKAIAVYGQKCPSCQEVIVVMDKGEGQVDIDNRLVVFDTTARWTIYPPTKDKVLSSEIPEKYRSEYKEAHAVLHSSPKASAALSRRLMQMIFREAMNIKRRDLSKEIDAFIETGVPTYLADAVDAIRQIGNFAAHPIKHQESGRIVDVEDGEAEWILEVVQALLDFTFVQPAQLKKRQNALNKKLESLGKPPLKSS